jgi:hypothetical protein
MELLIALAMKFWQWSLLILIVIIGFGVNLLDKNRKPKLKFNYKGMPHIKPLPIKTKGKGFWKAIVMCLSQFLVDNNHITIAFQKPLPFVLIGNGFM